MPLSTSAPRQLMHNRAIECRGYQREDGLWDIEGHLVDTKTYPTSARDTGRARQPGPMMTPFNALKFGVILPHGE